MKKGLFLLLSVFILVLDQWSKHQAQMTLLPYQPESLFSMVNLTLVYNTGATFGFLHQAGSWHRWFLLGFSSVMSILLLIWMIRLPSKATLQHVAVALILGGALGNLYDRIKLSYVIDFIQVYYRSYYWPVFNLADVAICFGVMFLLIDYLKQPRA